MTMTTSHEPGRARWLLVGGVLGAMVLASVFWVGGALTSDDAGTEMDQTAPTDMPGMAMSMKLKP